MIYVTESAVRSPRSVLFDPPIAISGSYRCINLIIDRGNGFTVHVTGS